MKKLLLILILTHISSNAIAEWTWLYGDEDSGTYVDLSTLRKTGSKAKIWILSNDKPLPGKEKERSTKMFFELDCSETNARMLAFSSFSKSMGIGQPISTNSSNSKWMSVEPASTGQAIWQVACEKNTNEWTRIDESKEPKDGRRHYQYVDLETVAKTGDFAKIWQLTDIRSVDPATQFKNFSVKALQEFNCKNRQTRYLEIVLASGNMGIGTKTREMEELYRWEPITTGSVNELMLSLSCKTSEQ